MMTPPAPTDLDLVRGLHAQSHDAFTRVYGDYHAAVYNLCARILGDREEAKDVTQDVFIKAFSRPPAAMADVRLRPWLYRVATNACLNLVRGRRSGGGLAEIEALPAVGDAYEQAQSAALIEQSLAGINERYRAALVLKDLHGLGGGELAEVLGVSRPAADVLVHRARASFKKVFTGLAGEGASMPANLALMLPPLSVPAALQLLPPLSAALTPHAAAPHGAIAPDLSSAAGPAGVGLLAKLGAALGTKAAIVVAAVVAGGGLAGYELARDGTAGGSAAASSHGFSSLVAAAESNGHHWVSLSPRDQWAEHRHDIAGRDHGEHHAAHDRSGHHSAGGRAHDGGGSAADATHASYDGHTAVSPSHETPAASTTTSSDHSGGDATHEGDGEH